MSWLFSQALVEASLEVHCWAGAPSAPLSKTDMPLQSWLRGKMTEPYTHFRSGMTLQPLTAEFGEAVLTSYLAAFPAKTYRLQARNRGLQGNGQVSGESLLASFATWNPHGSSWRTVQRSLLEDWTLFSGTWPRSGTMRNGTCSERTTLARRTAASASGLSVTYPTPVAIEASARFNRSPSPGAALRPTLGAMAKHALWPTPTVHGNDNRKGLSPKSGDGLKTAVQTRMWPTPNATDYRDRGHAGSPVTLRRIEKGKQINLSASVSDTSGALNPDWVEWLMGWPIGWTALEPLATDKFRAWLRSHGASWSDG